jgi:trimeric autotransporter adhesin
MPVQTKIQFRRSIATDWVAVNPILSAGEVGYETDSRKFKIGDGTTAWNSLGYGAIFPSEFNELVDDRVNDLIVAGSNIGKSYNDSTNTLTISATGVSLLGHTHTSSEITNFNSSVSGLLPVKSVLAGNNITVTPTGDNGFVISSPVNEDTVKDIVGSTISGVSGIAFNYDSIGKIATISLSDPTIQSTDVTDFNSAVSGLVNGIYAPLNSPTFTGTVNGISKSMVGLGNVNNTSDADKPVSSATQSALNLKASLAGATFTGSVVIPSGSGNFNTLNVNNIPVSVSGHSHVSSDITNFNSSVSGLMGVKSLVGTSGIGIVNSAGTHTIAITGIPSSLITDLGNIATTEVVGRTGIVLTYDSVYDIMYIDTTGVSFAGHSHLWSSITDASSTVSLSELSYLSGVVAGTASAGKALVLDSSKNLSTVNNFSSSGTLSATVLNISSSGTIGDLIIGGNLTVNGSTTTINSTTITVDDKNLELGSVASPTDITADGAGITVKGATDKTFNWVNGTNSWTSSEHLDLASGKVLKVAGTEILSATNYTGKAATAGNADTVTTNANLTGPITSVGNATSIAAGVISDFHIASTGAIAYSKLNLSTSILNSDISASAAIVDTKLDTISTAGKVSNSATTATSNNTASTIVLRDASGNFIAGTITASLSGNATSVTNGVYTTDTGTVTNTMLAGSIANNKLLNSSVVLGSTTVSLGSTISNLAGLTSISGTSLGSPTTLYNCVIDGGTP